MTGKEHKDIFSSTECLSETDLRAYAENGLSEQEKLRVEKHLVDCELCSDALEGYSLMNNPSEFGLRTASIDRRIDAKSSSRSVFLNREKLSYVAAAAVVLIFCSIVFVLIENVSKESNQLVSDEVQDEDYKREVRKNNLVEISAPEKEKDPSAGSGEGKKDRNQDVAAQTEVSGKLGGVLKETNESEDGQWLYDQVAGGAVPAGPEPALTEVIPEGNVNQPATGGSTRSTLGWGDADNVETVVADALLNDRANADGKRRDSEVKGKDKDVETTAGFYREVKADQGKLLAKSEDKKAKEGQARAETEDILFKESKSRVVVSKSVQTSVDYSIVAADLASELAIPESDEAAEDDASSDVSFETEVKDEAEANDEEFAPMQGEEKPSLSPTVTSGEEARPRYVGGNEQMIQYLLDNIRYPDSAKAQQIEGTVMVQFQVEADSSVTNVISLNDIGGGLDKEAVRVVESMPDWIPARKRGKAVTEEYNLPVKFKLEK